MKPINSGIHYHIRWSSNSSLDWKSFPTKEEAIKLAEKLKKGRETYGIVARDGDCERCQELKLKAFFRPRPLIPPRCHFPF